ncbi:hypothetical protein [Streptomyces sp. bgisy100]
MVLHVSETLPRVTRWGFCAVRRQHQRPRLRRVG